MTVRFVQLRDENGARRLAVLADGKPARRVQTADTLRDLAHAALAAETTLAALALNSAPGDAIDLEAALGDGRVLAPIDHPDPAHLILSGTGLTHLGSAEGRDAMHQAAKTGEGLTDSMRMFMLGLEGGKPGPGQPGAQPEWFYKGDGTQLVAPGAPLVSPDFALDGGEEAEIAGVYLIDPDGNPRRLGFCLANEFSDHVTESGNYLWLAHSKLRQASLGPELLTGELPNEVRGVSRVVREGKVLWEKAFVSGEGAMAHTIANLEAHHFKYPLFRRPGDIHVHFFGAAALSFADQVKAEIGDVFEIAAEPFSFPLRNVLLRGASNPVSVSVL